MLKRSNKNILYGFAGVTALLFMIFVFGEAFKIPKTIDSYAQIYPHSKWILSKGTAGQINSSLVDFTHGFASSYQTTQFDRGEDISFLFDKSLSNKHNIEAGDTIIRIKSSQIQERIILAQGELAMAKANLLAQSTGDKTELIDEAKSNNVNLIMLGSHGKKGFSDWILGSVSAKVADHAPMPVLIIKKRS